MITKIAKTLEKTAVTKWKDMYSSLSRLGQKAINSAGLRTPNTTVSKFGPMVPQLAASKIQGVENSVMQKGYQLNQFSKPITALEKEIAKGSGGYGAYSGSATVAPQIVAQRLSKEHIAGSPFYSKHRSGASNELVRAGNIGHEGHEVSSNLLLGNTATSDHYTFAKPISHYPVGMDPLQRGISVVDPRYTAMHGNLEVLGKEYRDQGRTGYLDSYRKIRRTRMQSGEYAILCEALGKDVARSPITKKDLKILRNLKPHGVEQLPDTFGRDNKAVPTTINEYVSPKTRRELGMKF